MRKLKTTLLQIGDLLLTAGPVLLLAIGLMVVAYRVLSPTPPKRMVLATGPAQGAYAEFGPRYATALKKHGIEVELRTTRGSQENLALLQSGEVDVLSRQTTWTLTRDTANGLNFTGINYFDGQGFMVAKKLGVSSAKELSGATVCVQTGTTTELNARAVAGARAGAPGLPQAHRGLGHRPHRA